MENSQHLHQSGGYDIYHDLTIDAPLTKVFDAVSRPEHLIKWWPLTCSGNPQPGGEYNFFFGPEYNWFGKVTSMVPGKSFHIKMTHADEDWDPTSFGFDLQEENGMVLVQFWHVGWPACNGHFKRSSYCWALLLNGLKNYVEKEIVIPFEERN